MAEGYFPVPLMLAHLSSMVRLQRQRCIATDAGRSETRMQDNSEKRAYMHMGRHLDHASADRQTKNVHRRKPR